MLEILISSSVLILVLALLRLILRDKISARLQYALWLLVLARLLVPVSFFHSPVSVAEAAAPVTKRVEQLNGAFVFFRNAPVSAVYTTPENEMLVIQDATPNYAADQVILLVDVARYIWITGMAVTAAWFLFVNLRLARHLRRSRTPYAANHTPPVYVGSGVPSPCLFGLIRPAIYLTEQAAADPLQARLIVAHEKTHFRHGDTIWALLRSVCLVIWWFNPFVWLAAALSRQDGELACDEGTIKALGEEARFDYGRTLVGMAKMGARPSDLLCGATTMSTGKRSLKERVARIANAPKMSVTVAVIVLLIAAIAVGCTFSGAAPEKAETTPPAPTPTPIRAEPEIAFEPPGDAASASDTMGAEQMEPEPEVLGTYDRTYWDEVDRELAGFAVSGDVEVFISPHFEFDEELPEDDIFGPLTLEDYIYGTDGWKFTYDGEPIANDTAATIKVHDADGRTLWIMDDADALMIEEADGSITRVAYTSDPVDCADMIRHLLPWARGEYPAETPAPPVDEAQQERTEQILAELGLYTIPGQEPKNVDGSTDYYNELPYRPLWAKLITMEFQDYVDLVYSRWWSDEDLSEPANEEFFNYILGSTAEVYHQTTGLSVNGHKAFSYTDTIGFVSIVWLDEQSNLIFQLYDPILHGETAATDDDLIALAETVSPQ